MLFEFNHSIWCLCWCNRLAEKQQLQLYWRNFWAFAQIAQKKNSDVPGKLNPPESFFDVVPLDNGGTSGELWNFQALIQVQVLKARALP